MTFTSEERDTRIPYRLGTDHYCTYEDEGEDLRKARECWHMAKRMLARKIREDVGA